MQDTKTLDVLSDDCFGKILQLTHKLTGITIGTNRKSMVQGRLRKRAMALGLGDYESYLKMVQTNPVEEKIFIDLITTNETYFFRTPRIWDYIEKIFLPKWHQENPQQTFQAWSAAASSGEEAHSLGVLCQQFREKHPNFNYQILGTDISQEMVSLCQQGLYRGRSIEAFKTNMPQVYAKYIQESEQGCRVTPEIKSRLKFQQHNLFQAFIAKNKFDLILLRNVLIYFTQADQESVLKRIAPHLHERGNLIIGESESLTTLKSDFKNSEPLIYSKADQAAEANRAA